MLKFKAFGPLNEDDYFIVIRQESQGRGLFSLLSAIICWIDFAEKNQLIPIVDFKNFKTVYNENDLINGTLNSFEYYFKPLNKYTLDEVYQSKNVCFSSNTFPENYGYPITQDKNLYNIYKSHFKFTGQIQKYLDDLKIEFSNIKMLGVHFRGKEMRTAGGHMYPPTLKQMKSAINKMLLIHNYQKIFVSSEDFNLIKILKKEYPEKIIYNKDYYRSTSGNAYKENPRNMHKFKLGREILADVIILSKCDSFIYSASSNVAVFAHFLNRDNYKRVIQIINPINFKRFKLYCLSWYIKRLFPSFLFGFKLDENAIKVIDKSK